MAKLQIIKCDAKTEDARKSVSRLEESGYLLTDQTGSALWYESTDEDDKDLVIEKHNRYMKAFAIIITIVNDNK